MAKLFPNYMANAQKSYNTGTKGTPYNPRTIIGLVITPEDYKITLAQLNALQTTWQSSAYAQDKKLRIYTLGPFGEAVDASTDAKKTTWGYGYESYSEEGKPIWSFYPLDGSMYDNDVLRKFNFVAKNFRVWAIDSGGVVLHTSVIEGGVKYFRGLTLQDYYAPFYKLNTGEGTKPMLTICLKDPTELHEKREITLLDFDAINSIKRINDVVIEQANALTSGVVSLRVRSYGDNLSDKYGTELATANAWDAYKVANGNDITITSVANGTLNGEKVTIITFDTGDADYPTSTNQLVVKMEPIADLVALGLDGYESNELVLTV